MFLGALNVSCLSTLTESDRRIDRFGQMNKSWKKERWARNKGVKEGKG